MKKRFLALVLTVAMIIGIVMPVNAAEREVHEHHVTITSTLGDDWIVPLGTDPYSLIKSYTCDDGCELSGKPVIEIRRSGLPVTDLSEEGWTVLDIDYNDNDHGTRHYGNLTVTIYVEDPQNPISRRLTGVSLDKTEVTVNKGEEFTLTLSAQPQNAAINENVHWRYNNGEDLSDIVDMPGTSTEIGEFDQIGTFCGIKAGTTTVTASLQGFRASCKVTVLDNGSPDNPSNPSNPSNPGGGNPTGPAVSYPDVAAGDWFRAAVNYVTENKLMSGYDSGYFGPADDLGRGQFATILYRIEGLPATAYEGAFPDVPNGAFYAIPAVWANKNQIITGYNDGRFGPSDTMTREQLATMMYRYAAYKGWDVSARGNLGGFPDAGKVTDYAKEAVSWAVGMGLISGDQGKINPQGTSSRAVTATIIQRFGEKY